MLDAEQKSARRRLDALLREAPDRMLRILEEGDLSGTLTQLREAEAPGPEWVRAKARNIRFKCGCAQAGLQGLADELRAALAAWEAGGGADHLRAGQAELVLKQLEAKSEDLRAVRERMKTLIAQADSAEAGARQAELFQALAQFRRFGREETQ